jgi:hypothetical protein
MVKEAGGREGQMRESGERERGAGGEVERVEGGWLRSEGLEIFRVCLVFSEAVFYNASAFENRGINRGGHVKSDRIC